MNVKKVSDVLVEIMATGGEESLKIYAEAVLKDCGAPGCDICNKLREALNESTSD